MRGGGYLSAKSSKKDMRVKCVLSTLLTQNCVIVSLTFRECISDRKCSVRLEMENILINAGNN